ncbi:peptidyl-prolyl cis/trans isomerase [Erysipelotrichaceae bacterium]|nr:peptidyl-prolyl cis/trans isomerase [Erysipelotrichaceae bacterium]
MSTQIKKLEGNYTEITIDVTLEQFEAAVVKAYEKVSVDVTLPGFRKGKVPQQIFEKKYGKESLYQDALDEVISVVYREFLENNEDIVPVAYPKVDLAKFEPESEITLKIVVATKPEVTLGAYKGMEVESVSIEVTDEDVQAEIAKMVESFSEMEIKETDAENGDTVVIDFEGFKDDIAFEGGKGENHSLELGSNSFIPGFEEQLIGVKSGDELKVKVTFPEAYHSEDLAGAEAVFNVLIHEVKTKIIPELTAEIIEKLELEDIKEEAELLKHVSDKLNVDKKNNAEAELKAQVLAAVVANATIELPKEMVAMQTDKMLENFGQQLGMQGLDLPKYYELTGTTEEMLREQMAPDAEKQIKESLVLEAIVIEEAIEVEEADIDAKLAEMAVMYKMEVEQLKGLVPNLGEDLKIEKAIAFLIDNSKK